MISPQPEESQYGTADISKMKRLTPDLSNCPISSRRLKSDSSKISLPENFRMTRSFFVSAVIRTPVNVYLEAIAFSTAPIIGFDKGSTSDLKRPITSPLRPIRNFSKFQSTWPENFGWVVRYLYSGDWPEPRTTIFENISNSTP